MDERESMLVGELLLNSRRSDRDLAKDVKASQPTVGRIRTTLEEEGRILEYTIIPDLAKLDVELISFIAIKWRDYKKTRELGEFESFIKDNKHVFFAAPGEGFQDKTKLITSFHKDYKSYEIFIRDLRANFSEIIEDMDTFLASTDNTIKNLISNNNFAVNKISYYVNILFHPHQLSSLILQKVKVLLYYYLLYL